MIKLKYFGNAIFKADIVMSEVEKFVADNGIKNPEFIISADGNYISVIVKYETRPEKEETKKPSKKTK